MRSCFGRRGSIEKGSGPVSRLMLVRIQPSALDCPNGVADGIGLSEGPGPGSTPGRDTRCPAGVTDGTAVFETARRGSIPRRGAFSGVHSQESGVRKDNESF